MTNIIYQFSIKYKQVTRNVLAAELYEMAHGFDIEAVIKVMLEKILESTIPLLLYINSKSLYDYLVQLDTI